VNVIAAAGQPARRSSGAKLLVLPRDGELQHVSRTLFVNVLRRGDLVVANDAATLPASLHGIHLPSGADIEIRLAGRLALDASIVSDFVAVVFGAGDFHTRTEERPLPPDLRAGDRFRVGPLVGSVTAVLGHPRLVSIHFDGSADAIWAGLAEHGRPIQYAHIATPLAMWDVWTAVASPPVAFEPPSAGFALDWRLLRQMRAHGIEFATITHAAGISSTGDEELDKRLPLDEPYDIPRTTADAIRRTKSAGGRIVAIGTTVVRALEHASRDGVVKPGPGVATQRIGPRTTPTIVDAILTGVHEPGTSHYDLLRAFVDDAALESAHDQMVACGYRTHEFGDSVFVERQQERNGVLSGTTRNAGACQGTAIALPVS
jgi:S-adenosylmethionine:tRNA ribosyltransferase-isomerase